MKSYTIRAFFIAFISMLLFTACANQPPASEEDNIENLTETILFAMSSGDTDTVMANLDYSRFSNEELPAVTEKLPGLLHETKAAIFDSQQGLKSIEFLDTEISENGNSATVRYLLIYGNGNSVRGIMHFNKVDGKWKSILSFEEK